MDSVFLLDDGDRAAFLQHIIQSVGCSYICLWSFPPQSYNFLSFLDGIYHEISSRQLSSSSGSLARKLFDEYSQSVSYVDTGRIPGFSFTNNVPYMELKEHDFQRMASSQVQLDFYQEAGIKTVVFMSCTRGEIELGMCNESQLDLQMEMKSIFPAMDFSQQAASTLGPQPAVDQNRPSSSSSSLRSLSFDSPDQYSPLIFNIPTTSLVQEPLREAFIQQSQVENALKSVPFSAPSMSVSLSPQQAIQDLSQLQNFPITIETADSAMTKAILAVLSSSSTSSSTQNIAPNLKISPASQNATPFQRYRMALAPVVAARNGKSNMFRRAVVFYRNLHLKRRQESAIQENRPTSAQLHHMINERRRREKLNESFQLLRSLLPVGSKKDKASVLSSTTDYLTSLKSQVEELSKRNQILEGRLPNKKEPIIQESVEGPSSSASVQQRVNVEMNRVPESTSEARIMDLRVTVRGECRMLDLVSRILEFLKQQRNLSLLSIESNTTMAESDSVHGLVLRLRIQGDEFDESKFQEAVKRVVDDSTH